MIVRVTVVLKRTVGDSDGKVVSSVGLVRFDPSFFPVSLLLVKLTVQSIVCLFWCR